jgi:hypothetical protein
MDHHAFDEHWEHPLQTPKKWSPQVYSLHHGAQYMLFFTSWQVLQPPQTDGNRPQM